MCFHLKLPATHSVIYHFCLTEAVCYFFFFCFSAIGRQLHVPGQSRSRRADLPTMRGKPPSLYDDLSFFKAVALLLQRACQAQLFLPPNSYIRVEQFVTTTRRLSLSISVLPAVIVKDVTLRHEFT